jgi:hypothetical protein
MLGRQKDALFAVREQATKRGTQVHESEPQRAHRNCQRHQFKEEKNRPTRKTSLAQDED